MSRYHLLTEEEQTENSFKIVIYILHCKYLFTKDLIIILNMVIVDVVRKTKSNIARMQFYGQKKF